MLLFLLGFPSGLVVDHGLEASRPPLAKRIYSAPYGRTNDMVMDMVAVRVCCHDISVIAMGESPGKLLAQPVCFLRGDLAGQE